MRAPGCSATQKSTPYFSVICFVQGAPHISQAEIGMSVQDGSTKGASGDDGRAGAGVTSTDHMANAAKQAQSRPAPPPTVLAPTINRDQIMATLKQLGELKASGVLTDEEFAAKRRELLANL